MSDELMKKIHSGFDHIESVQISTYHDAATKKTWTLYIERLTLNAVNEV
jgi:hypothetical protein